jgi:hypothetical protein
MKQPDVRVSTLDHFAIELEHEAQDAVRSRMLWPKVERVILDLGHGINPAFE